MPDLTATWHSATTLVHRAMIVLLFQFHVQYLSKPCVGVAHGYQSGGDRRQVGFSVAFWSGAWHHVRTLSSYPSTLPKQGIFNRVIIARHRSWLSGFPSWSSPDAHAGCMLGLNQHLVRVTDLWTVIAPRSPSEETRDFLTPITGFDWTLRRRSIARCAPRSAAALCAFLRACCRPLVRLGVVELHLLAGRVLCQCANIVVVGFSLNTPR